MPVMTTRRESSRAMFLYYVARQCPTRDRDTPARCCSRPSPRLFRLSPASGLSYAIRTTAPRRVAHDRDRVNLGLFRSSPSITACSRGSRVKRRGRAARPAQLERSVYVWIASLLFPPSALVATRGRSSSGTLRRRWRSGRLRAVQLAGLGLHALGCGRARRARRWPGSASSTRPPAPDRDATALVSKTDGLYGFVRHPLYFGWVCLVFGRADHDPARGWCSRRRARLYRRWRSPVEEREPGRDLRPGLRRAYRRRPCGGGMLPGHSNSESVDSLRSRDPRSVGYILNSYPVCLPTPTHVPPLPAELPVVPLRGAVVLPLTVAPLGVSRPMSVEAINRALAGDRMVLLLLQKNDDRRAGARRISTASAPWRSSARWPRARTACGCWSKGVARARAEFSPGRERA